MTFFKTVCACALAILPTAFLRAVETNAVPGAVASETKSSAEEKVPEEGTKESASDPKFDRYRTILDRMPFGPEPVNFDPDAPGSRGGAVAGAAVTDSAAEEAQKSQEEQKILASVRIAALNVTPSGKIAVGFTDSSKQPVGTYYLKVGESRDGWTVKAADPREMKVTLEREGVEATLGLGEGTAESGKDGKKGLGGGVVRPQLGRLARAGLLRSPQSSAPTPTTDAAVPVAGGGAIAQLRARRDQMRQAEEARQAAAVEQARAERAKAEAEREKAAAEREKAEAERAQQREELLQMQEELRRQREQKEQQAQQGEEQGAGQNDQ